MPEGTDSGIGNGPQLQSPALPEQQPPDLIDSGPGNGPLLEQPQQLADSGAGNGLQSEMNGDMLFPEGRSGGNPFAEVQ